jgi:hypothetical protein
LSCSARLFQRRIGQVVVYYAVAVIVQPVTDLSAALIGSARIANAVAVAVFLSWIKNGRAIVTGIPHAVLSIGIGLIGIGDKRAVVQQIGHAIAVGVRAQFQRFLKG